MPHKPREIKICLKTQAAGNICEEKTNNKFYILQKNYYINA